MKRKRLVSLVLILCLFITCTVFGLEQPHITYNNKTQELSITGQVIPLADVSIAIAKDNKRYFLDTRIADDQGRYTFRTKLPTGYTFETILSSSQETINFLITTQGNPPVGVNKTQLGTLIAEAKGKVAKDYTKESWNVFEQALKRAEAIYQDEYATQTEVDTMIRSLEKALQGLVPVNSGGGGGGILPQDAWVTFSVDKMTINKGYVISPTKVAIQKGDTVWDVFQRELDQRGISYDYTYSPSHGSVYVEAIDGDGEFDHGQGSGWMYNVNDYYPEYGADRYTLSAGDHVEWRYTTNLGKDLGRPSVGGDGNNLEIPSGDEVTIYVPKIDHQIFLIDLVPRLGQLQKLRVEVPQTNSKVYLNMLGRQSLPAISVMRGPLALEIANGTQIVSGSSSLGLFNPGDVEVIKGMTDTESLKDVAYYHLHEEEGFMTLSQPATVTIKEGSDLGVAWIVEDTLQLIPVFDSKGDHTVPYAYKDQGDLVIVTDRLSGLVTYIPEQAKPTYKDFDQVSDWAKEAVIAATKQGIIGGYEGYFKPKDPVTRAEFTKMLLHGLYGEVEHSAQSVAFKDVGEGDWYKPYIDLAYEKGIVQGDGDYFRPNDRINREQMATMLARALGLEQVAVEVEISDMIDISDWAKESVGIAYHYGLMNGMGSGFIPHGVATREMAVVVIMRGQKN